MIDATVYKNVLGSFPSGVTVVTTLDADGGIVGITANEQRCRELVEHSIGLVTALNPYIGYENATRIARVALETGRGVLELVREEKLLDEAMLNDILRPENMIAPRLVPLKA